MTKRGDTLELLLEFSGIVNNYGNLKVEITMSFCKVGHLVQRAFFLLFCTIETAVVSSASCKVA